MASEVVDHFYFPGKGKADGTGWPEGDGEHMSGVCRQGKCEKRIDAEGSEIMHPHILSKSFPSTS